MDISKKELIDLFKKFIDSTKTVLSEIAKGPIHYYLVSLKNEYKIELIDSVSFHTGWQTNHFTLKLRSTNYQLTEEEGDELKQIWYKRHDIIDLNKIEDLLNS